MPSRVHYTYTDKGLLDAVRVEIGCCEKHPHGVNFLEVGFSASASGAVSPFTIATDWHSIEEDADWDAQVEAVLSALLMVFTNMPDLLHPRSETSIRALASTVDEVWSNLDNQA